MKIKQTQDFTSGSSITAAYPAWLARLARKPVRSSSIARPVTLRTFHFFRERMAGINQTKTLGGRIKIGLAIAMLTALTGCVGVVADGGGGWWGGGWWGGDGGWWGGGDRGRDVHGFSARGAASRGVAHGGGGHAGGGGGGRR
jgi:hypothetical protein